MESSTWEKVRVFDEQGLVGRIAASKCKETNAVEIEVYLCTNEAMRPVRIDEKTTTEEGSNSLIVGTTDEDELTGGVSL